jgi:tape measure domain-containing protein
MAEISLKIKSDFEQAEKDFRELQSVSEATAQKINKFQESFKTEKIDTFIEKSKLNAIAIEATRGKTAAMEAEYKSLQREIERLIRSGMSPQDEAIKKLTKRYGELEKDLGGVKTQADKTGISFGKLTASIIGANVIERVLRGIAGGFKSIVSEAMVLEDAYAAFLPLMGSVEKTDELIKALNVTAAKTPFEFKDLQKSVSQLLPVMNGDIKKTIDTVQMLGDTAGGNAQKLDSITRGFTKAMLKGKVDMESLNMIAEAGVPIFTEMAKSMGYNTENMTEFFKKISTGTVTTDELVKAFKRMTSEGGIFYKGMVIASETTSGVFSTLRDNIAMTAAGIGQAFLPYIKKAALAIIDITSGILEWVSEGDNLKNLLSTLGYIFASITSGIIAYTVASNISAIASVGLSAAIKSLTAAALSNPFTAIAAVITAVLIPAIIYLVNNWDKVKYVAIDFALAVKEKMLELGLAIQQKVTAGVIEMAKVFQDLPVVGTIFRKIAQSELEATAATYQNIIATKQARIENKAHFEESQKQSEASIEQSRKQAQEVVANNNKIMASNKQRELSFVQMLENIKMSEQAQQQLQIEEAMKFFEQRAELEATDFESRIEFLQEQFDTINEMNWRNNDEKLAAEQGLRKSIEKEQEKLTKTRAQFGKSVLSDTSSMLQDLQTVFKNAGQESYALAVAMKAVAAAEALINSYLAYTRALAEFPPPMSYIAAAVALAAGLARQAAILSTPIPKSQTGLQEYTVPDTRTNRHDNAAVMASPGERVTVEPRGVEMDRTTYINIQIEEEPLFRIIQRGIDTGRLVISNRNIGSGVFA